MDWKNKKVFVTGADGFIGSHLVEALVKKGAEVKALSQYNSFNYWGWLDGMSCLGKVEVVSGDVRDPHFIKDATKGVDIVFNLAALIAIPYSYIAPDSYVDTNIKGAMNICQAARENNVSKVVQISTSEVYGTAQYVPIDEKHPLQPQSPYSATKIGADSIAMSFYNAFGLPVVIARPFNTYGPRQSARAIIPTIITQIANGKKEIHIGDTKPTRDFTYVEDTCGGMVALAESEEAVGQVVNIGSGSEISIGDLFELIRKIMKSNAEIAVDKNRLRPRNSEVYRLFCDNSKLATLTGFGPEYDLEKGLTKTVEWFIDPDNLKRYKSEVYNV